MSRTILFVDDESDVEALIVQRFRRQIREGSLRVLFARDGVEALATLAENPDVVMVVSDINMPRMDGLTLLARLQESQERPCTIVVSAYGDLANIRTAMNAGAFDFLTKPLDFGDLEATIDKSMRHVETLATSRLRQVQAERAHESLSRYFSPNLAARLADDPTGLDLGGRWQEVTSLFTDIEGFTRLVESLDPVVLVNILNEYLSVMTEVVFAHEGTVAKISGDAMHVLFGAPGDQPDHAERAVTCGLALNDAAEAFSARWRARDIAMGATRIGIHAGPAIVGNFGGGRFFDYTAHGDTINTASRLEAANKVLGTRVCVSGSVKSRIDAFWGRPVGDLALRGKQDTLRAYEPMSEASFSLPATKTYLGAFEKLEAGDPGALPAFASLLAELPDDRLVAFHLKRLLGGARGTLLEV